MKLQQLQEAAYDATNKQFVIVITYITNVTSIEVIGPFNSKSEATERAKKELDTAGIVGMRAKVVPVDSP